MNWLSWLFSPSSASAAGSLSGGTPDLGTSLEPTIEQAFGPGFVGPINPRPPEAQPSAEAPQPGAPMDIRSGLQRGGAGEAASEVLQRLGGRNPLDLLRGITAPKPPDVVKPATPHLPTPRPIQTGQLFQILQQLGALGGAGGGAGGLRLPATLGESLGGLGRR